MDKKQDCAWPGRKLPKYGADDFCFCLSVSLVFIASSLCYVTNITENVIKETEDTINTTEIETETLPQ